jgi:hypothetical protein
VFTSRAGKLIAGKAGYGVTCLLAAVTLVLSGYAHKVVGLVSGGRGGRRAEGRAEREVRRPLRVLNRAPAASLA